jgi:hypothetical protein
MERSAMSPGPTSRRTVRGLAELRPRHVRSAALHTWTRLLCWAALSVAAASVAAWADKQVTPC